MRTRPFTPIAQANLEEETVLQDYRNHVEERAAQNIPPKLSFALCGPEWSAQECTYALCKGCDRLAFDTNKPHGITKYTFVPLIHRDSSDLVCRLDLYSANRQERLQTTTMTRVHRQKLLNFCHEN